MKKIARKFISFLSIALLLVQSLATPFLVSPVYAATSPWTQTDWSTGDFASSANVTTSTAGQVTLATTEKLINGGFASGTEGGVANNWSTATVSAPPAGYVEVPSNVLYANPATYDATQPSKSNFLAMQYEAKYDCTATPDGIGDTAATCSAPADAGAGLDYRDIVGFTTSRVVSTALGASIVHITQTQAISACPTGHLITNNEWMTIARNAEAQTTNWANGTIGSTVASGGGLKRGNVGIADSASYNGADPEQGTGRDTKAKLALSNSSELWDLSGNVWEWNSDTITEANQPDVSGQSGFAWRELTALTSYGTLSYDLVRPLGSTYDANYGVGRIYHNSGSVASTVYAFKRGGYWGNGADAGVEALILAFTPANQLSSIGFRCASDPVAISQSFSSSSGRAGGGDTITIGSISDGKLYQSVNVGDTASYYIQAYVKMAVGSDPITSDVATLYYGGNTISNAAYTEVVGETGWYKLTGTVTGVASAVETGLVVKKSKTVIVDDLSVYNYDDSGTLTSSIFDTEFTSGAAWGTLSYNATTPGSTSVTVKARSSNSSSMTGATDFATCTAITSASDISTNNCVTDSHRYIQYQLTAATTDPLVTPTFADISIAFAAYDATAPSISLTALSPDPGSDNTPTLSGTATDSIGTVSNVQFQMDATSGSWSSCSADDGAFDEATETFTCTPSALSDGSHTMYVRATDSNGNTTGSGSESSDAFTIDATVPTSIDLDSPGNNSYTSSERPSFKWKATTDVTAGLSKYVLEIDNPSLGSGQPSGDFAIDDIPVSRTTDYETNRYVIHYENFSDSDSTNNYISVYTKSSSDWGSDHNDGKLREGKVSWKVKAVDNAGNETSSSRTLFVDRTNPALSNLTAVNVGQHDGYLIATQFRPQISGTITDLYPDKVSLEFYRENFFLGVLTSTTLELTQTQSLNNTTGATSLTFSITPSQNLDYGKYQIKVIGFDKIGNKTEDTLELQLLTAEKAKQLLTGTTKELKEQATVSLPELEKQAKIRRIEEAANLTKFVEENTRFLTWLASGIGQFLASAGNAGREFIAGSSAQLGEFFAQLSQGLELAVRYTVPETVREIGQDLVVKPLSQLNRQIAQSQEAVGRTSTMIIAQTLETAAMQTGAVVDMATGITQDLNHRVTDLETSSRSSIAKNWSSRGIFLKKIVTASELAYRSYKQPAAKGANFLYRVRVAFDTSQAILFDPAPTRIENVTIEELGADYTVVSWDTNHFTKNNKVNYGTDLTYGQGAWGEDYAKHHTIKLTGLKPGTEYFFEVMSQNKNYAYDAYYRFETKK